jgi:hypothetical protein
MKRRLVFPVALVLLATLPVSRSAVRSMVRNGGKFYVHVNYMGT